MDLPREDHVLRFVPPSRLHRDEDDNVIGVLPQAFELRLHQDEKYLSVNWLEYFKGDFDSNIEATVSSFRESRKAINARMPKRSAFCIGNVGKVLDTCIACKFPKVRIVYEKQNSTHNKSHSKIIRLPENDADLLDLFANDVFDRIVFNADIS